MNFTHTTKEGVIMLLWQMEDSHLENTVMLFLRKAKLAKDLAEQPRTKNKFIKGLLGNDFINYDEEDLGQVSNQALEAASKYILELYRRGHLYSPATLLINEILNQETRQLLPTTPIEIDPEFD